MPGAGGAGPEKGPMPRRIVIHPGFHKTGTSTIQHVLKANRPVLRPWMQSVLRGQMRMIVAAARGYSTWRDPVSLFKFSSRFKAFLDALRPPGGRVLCLSAEELSGHLPGRGDLVDFSAAPVLAARMAAIAARRFPGVEILFFYSTRAPGAWLESAYWHHVKASSMTLDWEDYARRYAPSADLEAMVDAVAEALDHPVHSARLEDTLSLPAGPAQPLLELCGIPPDIIRALPAPPPVNRRPDRQVLLELLAVNRRYDDPEARQAAKAAILQAAQEDAR